MTDLAIPSRGSEVNHISSFLSQVFRQYKDKLIEKGLGRNVRKPWMKYREIDLIGEILQTLRPQRCLEWGAGYSTTYFPSRLGNHGTWLSIEHDEEWAKVVRGINKRNSVTIEYVAPDNIRWGESSQDGTFKDFRNYIEFPASSGPFDFILVDGRARSACLQFAKEILNKRGVVILHDANRLSYREAWGSYPFQEVFTDYRSSVGGVWVGSNSADLGTFFDVEAHRKLWRIYSSLNTFNIGMAMHIWRSCEAPTSLQGTSPQKNHLFCDP